MFFIIYYKEKNPYDNTITIQSVPIEASNKTEAQKRAGIFYKKIIQVKRTNSAFQKEIARQRKNYINFSI